MTSPTRSVPSRRSLFSVRRARRWARHTPNGTIALNMITAGVGLIVLAIVLAVTVL